MTLSSTYTPAQASCNGSTTVFPFTFPVTAASDVDVFLTDSSGNTTSPTSGFTVTVNGTSGGSVTWAVAPASGYTHTIMRVLPLTQNTSIRNQSVFLPNVIEDEFDRLVMQDQQQQEQISRALLLPEGITPTGLPTPVSGSVLGWVSGAWAWMSGASVSLAANLLTASAGMGTSLINYLAPWTGAVARLLWLKLADVVHARDFGVVGDGITDDTTAFTAACAYAVSTKRELDISDLKIYMPTQAASIASDGLVLLGSGAPTQNNLPTNWPAMTGNTAQWDVVKAAMLVLPGSLIISKYNGPMFTGKALAGSGFCMLGYPANASNAGFVQSTPTTYPGWSLGIQNLKNVTICYFGSHGIELKGGLEMTMVDNIVISACNGYCLYIHTTTPATIDCPIEYLAFRGGSYVNGLLGNIKIDGAKKQILFDGLLLNDPAQFARQISAGTITGASLTYANMPYPIDIIPQTLTGMRSTGYTEGITVQNCYAESAQSLVRFNAGDGAYYLDTKLTNNFLIPYNNAWKYYTAHFAVKQYQVETSRNFSPSGVRFYLLTADHGQSRRLDFQERWYDSASGVLEGNTGLSDVVYVPDTNWSTYSGTIGDGTAATFTYNAADTNFTAPPTNTSSVARLLLITASFQGGTPNSGGAYLMAVVRNPDGGYIGMTTAFSSVVGFSSAPTMSTAGVISCPMSVNYRARVSRIDHLPANLASYA